MTLLSRMNKLLDEHHEASKETYFIVASSALTELSLINELQLKDNDESLITVFRLYEKEEAA